MIIGHRFAAQSLAGGGISPQMAGKDLDGYLPAEFGAFGPTHFAHATGAEQLPDEA